MTDEADMRALLITWHDHDSPARVSIHFFAEALVCRGWKVTWVTTRWGPRASTTAAAGRLVASGRRGLEAATIWRAHRRPMRTGAAAWLRISGRYRGGIPRSLAARARDADLIYFEPGEPLLHVAQFVDLNPAARRVYRVSDALESLDDLSEDVVEREAEALAQAHHVSFPSELIAARYRGRATGGVLPHAVPTHAFDAPTVSPYPDGSVNAVFTGMNGLDWCAVETAARAHPQMTIHVFGPWEDGAPALANLRLYGVRPFSELVPYLQHASLGLHPVPPDRPGAETLGETLKVRQYSYCHLPIVSPGFLGLDGLNVFSYRPGDGDSIAAAVGRALRFDRASFDPGPILSWDDFAAAILDGAGLPL